MAAPKEYLTLDNGGNPFRVVVDGMRVTVFDHYAELEAERERVASEVPADAAEPEAEPLIVLDEAEGVFVGKSHLCRMTEHSGARDDARWDGNTILVRLGGGKYVYIGESVAEFDTEGGSEIVSYWSPVGNSAVPYPWAVDDAGRTYLLIDGTVLLEPVPADAEDPYSHHWDAAPSRGKAGKKPRKLELRALHGRR